MASIQTQYAIFLSILLATIFFFKVNSYSAESEIETTSFSIPKFSSDQENIKLDGDAHTKDGKLILNEAKSNTFGTALYSAPIRIFDSKTDKVANFTTSFTFVRDVSDRDKVAIDSIAFFIDTTALQGNGIKTAHTVVVEFDTSYPLWGETSENIRIYVNGEEIAHESCNLQKRNEIVISFNGVTDKLLTVRLNHQNSLTTLVPLKFSHEWVSIGLSGRTGAGTKVVANEILSWSFKSDLNVTSSSKQVAYA